MRFPIRYLCSAWEGRTTLYYLFLREFKARYRYTYLGYLWALLQPFSLMLVLTAVFTLFAPMKTDVPYPVLSFLNLSVWAFFAGSITGCMNSLLSSGALLKKIYFPRMILPFSVVLGYGVDFLVALLGVACLIVVFKVPLSPVMPLVLLAVAWQLLLCLALGMGVAMLTLYFRDLRHLLTMLLQLWLFASPVIYPLDVVPERYRAVYMLNPMAGVLTLYDNVLLRGTVGSPGQLGISLLATLLVTTVAYGYFVRRDLNCVDLV